MEDRLAGTESVVGVAEDGTQPEDLAIYLEGLDRYRGWFVRETPESFRPGPSVTTSRLPGLRRRRKAAAARW